MIRFGLGKKSKSRKLESDSFGYNRSTIIRKLRAVSADER